MRDALTPMRLGSPLPSWPEARTTGPRKGAVSNVTGSSVSSRSANANLSPEKEASPLQAVASIISKHFLAANSAANATAATPHYVKSVAKPVEKSNEVSPLPDWPEAALASPITPQLKKPLQPLHLSQQQAGAVLATYNKNAFQLTVPF